MKLLAIAALGSVFAVVGVGQRGQSLSASSSTIILRAENETKQGGSIKLRGHVEVIAGQITVSADEADYDPLSGSLETRGRVYVTFKGVTPAVKIENASPEDLPATAPPRQ